LESCRALEIKPACSLGIGFGTLKRGALCESDWSRRAGDVAAARRSNDEIAAIRGAMPATRDYDWSGSLGAQWEAAAALIAWAKERRTRVLRLLAWLPIMRTPSTSTPVTPGALLPVREMLADLLLEMEMRRRR